MNREFTNSCKDRCSLLEKLVLTRWKQQRSPGGEKRLSALQLEQPEHKQRLNHIILLDQRVQKQPYFRHKGSEVDLCSILDLTLFCRPALLLHHRPVRGDVDISDITGG